MKNNPAAAASIDEARRLSAQREQEAKKAAELRKAQEPLSAQEITEALTAINTRLAQLEKKMA